MRGMFFQKWSHYIRARLLEIVRRPDGALREYEAALRIAPDFRKAANALAWRYAQAGRDAQAIACFQRVLELRPKDFETHFNLGFLYARTGEHRKAIESFHASTALNDRFDRAWYGMGLAQAALGEHDKAVAALERAAELQPMASPVWYQLGMACHHAREPGRLRAVIRHLNRFDPRTARRLILDTGTSDLAYLVKDLEL
jgi:tetratricopeptide (TPR) repeat protein